MPAFFVVVPAASAGLGQVVSDCLSQSCLPTAALYSTRAMTSSPGIQELRDRRALVEGAEKSAAVLACLFAVGFIFDRKLEGALILLMAVSGTAVGLLWKALFLRERFVLVGTLGVLFFLCPACGMLPQIFRGAVDLQEIWLRVPHALSTVAPYYLAFFLVLSFSRPRLLPIFDQAIAKAEERSA